MKFIQVISTKPTAKMYRLNILWTDTWIGYPPLHINKRTCSAALISLHKHHKTVLLSINMVLLSYQYLKWVPDITLQKKQYRLTPCNMLQICEIFKLSMESEKVFNFHRIGSIEMWIFQLFSRFCWSTGQQWVWYATGIEISHSYLQWTYNSDLCNWFG